MKYIVNAEQMQQIDKISIEKIGIPSMVLMERAALGVTNAVCQIAKPTARCLVIAGTGNNGGDGLAVARQLRESSYAVDVFIVGDSSKGSDSFIRQLNIIKNLKIPILDQLDIQAYDVIIDGLFGVGLSRDIKGEYADCIKAVNRSKAAVIAIDIPSGIHAGTGQIMGCAVKADYTVTFGFIKYGLVLFPGAEYAGSVTVEGAGFTTETAKETGVCAFHYEEEDVYRILPRRRQHSNKGDYGRVGIFAGGRNMAGAAFLSGLAAYETGCGLVRFYTHEANRVILQTLLPEAVITAFSCETDFEALIKDAVSWSDAIIAGPGLGTGHEALAVTGNLFKFCTKPMVLDADGINLLAENLHWLDKKQCDLIVTPHLKEMSRLNGKPVTEIAANLVSTACDAAVKYDLTCVLKDARSVVTQGQGDAYINMSGNSGMACAGSGDVLTGMIGALLAQRLSIWDAAVLGVFLHGLSGDKAKEKKGEASMRARDIIENIHEALGGNEVE